MKQAFEHVAQTMSAEKPLVYTAFSKHFFYLRMFISEFVLNRECVPLNPFMIFDYFLSDKVDRNIIRESNNNLVRRSDELWVFCAVSDGVLSEVILAKQLKKPIRFFDYEDGTFFEVTIEDVVLEDGVKEFRHLL